MNDGEQMAIMKHVEFGCDDRGRISLRFEAYTSESSASGQYLTPDQAVEWISHMGVDDIHKLEGKPCVVKEDGAFARFVRMLKI